MEEEEKPKRLKINKKEVGLRYLGDGLYEPNNLDVFEKIFHKVYVPNNEPFFKTRSFPEEEPQKYHKIESFCFVVTENIKEEAELLLRSLREFHDQPVYVICDEVSRKHIAVQGLSKGVLFKKEAEQEELNKINEKIFKGHGCIANNVHSAPCILKKMDVMDFALQHHDNTFFLDADIIVLDNLQEYFTCSLVLSPHYFPKTGLHKAFEYGFYNAGYIFCAEKGFPRFWKHMYLNDSTFFEQECMNRIPDHYKIQTFGEEHNVGLWRGEDSPEKAKSTHAHITTGVDKNRSSSFVALNEKVKDYTFFQSEKYRPNIHDYVKKYHNPNAKKKLAFIHFGKTGGVYVNHYLREYVMPTARHYNSWWNMKTGERHLNRDWSKGELLRIAGKKVNTALAHNHHINWCEKTIKAFKDNGWLTFMFLRNPKDLMCSLFFWSRKQRGKWRPALPLKRPYVGFGAKKTPEEITEKDREIIEGIKSGLSYADKIFKDKHVKIANPLSGILVNMSGQDDPHKVTLDDFIKFIVTSEGAQHLWVLPDYIDEIDYVAEFNDKNFGDFLNKYFSHDYVPRKKRNVSKNKGYKYYCDNGDIPIETQELIESHPEYKKYSKYLNT
jgi:hypothetical protein